MFNSYVSLREGIYPYKYGHFMTFHYGYGFINHYIIMGWIYVLNTHPLPHCWYRVPLCQNFDSWLGDIPWAIARDVA